jgi:hypothetical protein
MTENHKKIQKIKSFRGIHVLCHLMQKDLTKMNFALFCKIASCIDKTGFPVAYEVEKNVKSIISK